MIGKPVALGLEDLCQAMNLSPAGRPYARYFISERPFTGLIDPCIHPVNIWTCSVPLHHGGKGHNLHRETYLGQVAAPSLTLRP